MWWLLLLLLLLLPVWSWWQGRSTGIGRAGAAGAVSLGAVLDGLVGVGVCGSGQGSVG